MPADFHPPPGHSRAAHRVHGWCGDCRGHTALEEVIAWRVRENEVHERVERARGEAGLVPAITVTAADPTECPECGNPALSVVTVFAPRRDGGQAQAGGWALCSSCYATPYGGHDRG
jgi:hypothetical protein